MKEKKSDYLKAVVNNTVFKKSVGEDPTSADSIAA